MNLTNFHTSGETPYRDEPYHYFASSVAQWRVDTDLVALLHDMAEAGYDFNVWLVHKPQNATYKIKAYAPDVEKLEFVGFFERRQT